jgi:hypothetical protein
LAIESSLFIEKPPKHAVKFGRAIVCCEIEVSCRRLEDLPKLRVVPYILLAKKLDLLLQSSWASQKLQVFLGILIKLLLAGKTAEAVGLSIIL